MASNLTVRDCPIVFLPYFLGYQPRVPVTAADLAFQPPMSSVIQQPPTQPKPKYRPSHHQMPNANAKYVSVDPTIYEQGGFHDSPEIYNEIQSKTPASDNISVISGIYPDIASLQHFYQDNIFGDKETIDNLKNLNKKVLNTYKHVPSSVLTRIEHAIILDRSLYIQSDNRYFAIYETHRLCDRDFLTYTNPLADKYDLPNDRTYLLLTSAGTFNWGHWLIDDLTKLSALTIGAKIDTKKLCILIHGIIPSTDRVRMRSIEWIIGPSTSVEIRLLRPDRAYTVRRLYYPSPVTYHPFLKHPLAVRDLAKAGRLITQRTKRWTWRPIKRYGTDLFVLRRPALGRVPENWQQLHDFVVARGFTPFDPQGVEFSEQVTAFVNAERVIGLMGAAMSNTVFCRPGTRVLYFAPNSFLDPFYPGLAAACQHDYAVCYGSASNWERAAKSNYVLDPQLIHRALDWICRA